MSLWVIIPLAQQISSAIGISIPLPYIPFRKGVSMVLVLSKSWGDPGVLQIATPVKEKRNRATHVLDI